MKEIKMYETKGGRRYEDREKAISAEMVEELTKHWPYKIWCDCVKRALTGRRLSETKPENSLL